MTGGTTAGARVVQFSDPHIVAPGRHYALVDTAAYLAEAVAFVNTLAPAPQYVVVTGDLVNGGSAREYRYFAELMRALRVPYFVIMGNHDERGAFRANLAPQTYGHAQSDRIRFTVDDYALRFIALDANPSRHSRLPRADLDRASLDWLETTLAAAPERPTLLAVHQPPFRTGMHYFDVFGYGGRRRLRSVVKRAPQVGRVLCGHIHCVKTYVLGTALVASAPSTAPQMVPEFFDRHILGMRQETAGFTLHEWAAEGGFASTVYRRMAAGRFAPEPPLAFATRR